MEYIPLSTIDIDFPDSDDAPASVDGAHAVAVEQADDEDFGSGPPLMTNWNRRSAPTRTPGCWMDLLRNWPALILADPPSWFLGPRQRWLASELAEPRH